MQKRAHQSFVAMRSVIAVRDFVNRYARFSRPLRSGILFFMRVLEKHLRTPLFIDAPEVVELPPQIVRRADAIAPLREKGVFQQLFKVKQLPDEPQLIRYVVRSVNGETSEMGADFEDEALAYIRALGEGVERFVWKNFPYAHMSVQSTQQYLTDAHIDVTQVAGFSDELRAQHTKLQINEADSFRWVRGTIADSREPIWIPLQFMQCQHDEKQIRPTITTGLSAHESYKRARNAGLMEIIERDAFMLSYVNQHTPERINNQAVTLPKLRRALQVLRLESSPIKTLNQRT